MGNMNIHKLDYWHDIVDYYYDNIHWNEDPAPSIYEWLERDFKAYTSLHSTVITFRDPARYQWFIMRWGHEISA